MCVAWTVSIECGWLSQRVEKTQYVNISHLYHSILHVICERMVVDSANITRWILPGTRTISPTRTSLSGNRDFKFVRRILTNAVISSASISKMKLKSRIHKSGSISRDMNVRITWWITRVVLHIALSGEKSHAKLVSREIITFFSWKVTFFSR